MRKIGAVMSGLALSVMLVAPAQAGPSDGITWLGHASFRIERKGAVVYVDPWKLTDEPHDADIVLITHPHFDHLSVPDIQKVAKGTTVVVGPPDCLKELTGDLRPVKPGDSLTLGAVTVDAVPAYNTNKAYHPKQNQWVGYVITIGKTRIYHAGDTDVIPEMHGLLVDVALLPVSGTYVMTAEEAATAAALINPKLAIPMHYGTIIGGEADARRFQSRCEPIPVKILTKPSAAAPAPADLIVSSQVDKTRLTMDEPLRFSVTIAGPITTVPRVAIESLKAFRVLSTGQSQSVTVRGGQTQLAITLEYLLAPLAAGKQTLGPVTVEHEGKRYQTTPIEVEVVAGEHPPLRGGTVL